MARKRDVEKAEGCARVRTYFVLDLLASDREAYATDSEAVTAASPTAAAESWGQSRMNGYDGEERACLVSENKDGSGAAKYHVAVKVQRLYSAKLDGREADPATPELLEAWLNADREAAAAFLRSWGSTPCSDVAEDIRCGRHRYSGPPATQGEVDAGLANGGGDG